MRYLTYIYNYRYFFSLLFALALSGCNTDDEENNFNEVSLDKELSAAINETIPGGIKSLLLPDFNNFSEIPQDANNPITAEKVSLGKMLFHETALGTEAMLTEGMLTYSCSSCHNPKSAMQSGRRQGIADGGNGFGLRGEGRSKNPNYQELEIDAQPIRAPSILNVAYQKNLLWNGMFGSSGLNVGTDDRWIDDADVNLLGFEGVESQAIKGLEVHRMNATYEMMNNMGYMDMLREAFPDVADDTLTSRVYMGLAIGAYVRTITTSQAPFQKWLRGDKNALSEEQKRGATLFFDKAKCVSCHAGPGLNTMEFAAVGMNDLTGDDIFRQDLINVPLGRASFTGNPADNFKFKIPQLYNLKDAPFYGHGSSFSNLKEVVEYFNEAIPQKNIDADLLDDNFKPLNLSDNEIDDLVSFLRDGLYDDNLERHIPDGILSNNCFPNADVQSKSDLGCD